MSKAFLDPRSAVLLLESVRAGIPSRLSIEHLPDLRENVTARIDTDLSALAQGESVRGRIVWGEYGQGKTHFLKTIEQHVLQQGFAVSYYTLNRDVGLNNLKVLFPMLASQTLTPDSRIPGIMNQLMHESMQDGRLDSLPAIEAKISHPLPSYVLQTLHSYLNMDEMMLLYSCLMGNFYGLPAAKSAAKNYLPHLIKQMPKFNQKAHAHAFIEFYPYLLQLLGCKGWVILIDEIELIGKLGKIGRMNSYINLSYLLNWNKEHQLPIYTLVASAKTLQTDVFFSRKNDVVNIPACAKERGSEPAAQRLRRFFELAGGNSGNLILSPIPVSSYLPLYTELFRIHQQAITWVKPAGEELIAEIVKVIHPDHQPIRMNIRMFIELLDIYATTGVLLTDIKSQQVTEYDLSTETEGQTDIDFEGKGFQETTLNEMFDDV